MSAAALRPRTPACGRPPQGRGCGASLRYERNVHRMRRRSGMIEDAARRAAPAPGAREDVSSVQGRADVASGGDGAGKKAGDPVSRPHAEGAAGAGAVVRREEDGTAAEGAAPHRRRPAGGGRARTDGRDRRAERMR